MFDHLDDPAPFQPSADFRAGVRRRGRSLRRHRRLALGGATSVVLLVGAAVGALAYVDSRVGSIDRVEAAGLVEPPAPGAPRTVLFVGSDGGRADADAVAARRSDTIVLARVDADANTLMVLPVPRDLWVEIDGRPGRINQALVQGGPDLLIRTIEEQFAIAVNHYVEVDVAGAVALGDAIGGVDLEFATPVRDRSTGLDLGAGCTQLGGEQLLAVARARHLEVEADGRWEQDRRGDLGRIDRQQVIAAALLGRLASLDAGNPVELARVFEAAVDHLVLDAETTVDQLRSLAQAIVGAEVQQLRVPVADLTVDGAAGVALEPDAEAVLDAFRDGRRVDPLVFEGSSSGTSPFLPRTC